MKLIYEVHPETREILLNARDAHQARQITDTQYNDVVRNCFRFEEEYKLIGKYPETTIPHLLPDVVMQFSAGQQPVEMEIR